MKTARYFLIALILFIIVMLIIYPELYVISVYNGFILFCVSVLPAMFPFFFFSKLLTSLGTGDDVARVLKHPIGFLYNTPSVGAYIFGLSILSGYPVGAKILSDYFSAGAISESDAKSISAYTSTSGPLFIVGTVGLGMFGNKYAGYIILAAHIISALLNGLVFRSRKKPQISNIMPTIINYDKILSDSITGAIKSVLIVGGYVAIFNMIADLALNMGAIDFLATPISAVFKIFGIPSKAAMPTVISLIEVTRGALELSKSGINLKFAISIAAGAISFGGLSVTLQSLTFLSKCKIKAKFYLLSKTTQGIIGFTIAYILCLISGI